MPLSAVLQQIRRHHQFLTAGFLLAGSIFLPLKVMAVSLDPYPVYDSFHDESSISFFRE